MFAFLSVVAVCATVIYLARFLVGAGVSFSLPPVQIAVTASPAVAPGVPGDTPDSVVIPNIRKDVLQWCALDSEQFMREKNLDDARAAYARAVGDHTNDDARWDAVLLELQRKAGETLESNSDAERAE